MASHQTCATTCGHQQRWQHQQDNARQSGNARALAETVEIVDSCYLLALPDELLLVVLGILSDPAVLACAAPTARRLGALCRDDALWRCLYERRYGQPIHDHFAEFGKDWRWLYRARATRSDSFTPVSPGCAVVEPQGHYFCGELRWGVPHGYGLRVRVTFPLAGDAGDPRAAFDLPRDRFLLLARSEGQWERGTRHGRVFQNMPNGDRYQGNFVNGVYHGDSVYIHRSGRVYHGAYSRGERKGMGVEDYPDGRRYEGQWNGKRNGEGTMTLPDGRSHRGQWRDGKPHGWGVHTWPNGQRVEAAWRDGTPRGRGMLVTASGRCFVDDAKVVFCLGGVTVPTNAGGIRGDNNGWGAHLSRVCVTSCDGAQHRCTVAANYIDGSQLLAFWGDGGLCAYRVGLHSPSCQAADRPLLERDEKAQAVAAREMCMACLCDALTRTTRPHQWYFSACA